MTASIVQPNRGFSYMKSLTDQVKNFNTKYKDYNSPRENKEVLRKISEAEEFAKVEDLIRSKLKKYIKQTSEADTEEKLPYGVQEMIEI